MFVLLVLVTFVGLSATEAPPVYYAGFVRFQRVEQLPHPVYNPATPPGQARLTPPGQTTEHPEEESTTTELPTTTKPSKEDEEEQIKRGDNRNEQINEEFTQRGVYYIYHPNGLLQRVAYSSKNDVEDMGYIARLQYSDVEPIKDPIYTYDPQTLVFQRIQF